MNKSDIEAFSVIEKARESDKFCCLTLFSDYDYCWEIKWVFADKKGHKEHRTHCHDTLKEVVADFKKQPGFT